MTTIWRCTPVGATVNYDTALNLECATKYLEEAGATVKIGMQAGTFCDHTHNLATVRFLASGADFLWWIDSDMLFPSDAGVRLLNCASALAGVVYRRRLEPNDLMGLRADKKAFVREDEGIVDAFQLGTGCLMVHRSVYEGAPNSLKYPWYENLYGSRVEEFEGGDTVFVRKAVQAGHSCRAELYVSRDVYHTGPIAHGWFDLDDTTARATEEHKDLLKKGAYTALGEINYPTPQAEADRVQQEFVEKQDASH